MLKLTRGSGSDVSTLALASLVLLLVLLFYSALLISHDCGCRKALSSKTSRCIPACYMLSVSKDVFIVVTVFS